MKMLNILYQHRLQSISFNDEEEGWKVYNHIKDVLANSPRSQDQICSFLTEDGECAIRIGEVICISINSVPDVAAKDTTRRSSR